MTAALASREFHTIQGLRMEVERFGSGAPMLVLLSEESALELESPFLSELAKTRELIIPQPPGFGRSERPDWVSGPDDIAYMYLDLVERLGLKNIPVLAFSLGAYIAAQMAVKDDAFISQLILAGALGVKTGGPFDRGFMDIWTSLPEKVMAWKWADPGKGRPDLSGKTDEELAIVARNTESFARYCWEPYMHDPKLKRRLHRIRVPALFVWGAQDGFVTPACGKAYAELIPGAKFTSIADAGHYPHLEQPRAFLAAVHSFTG